MKINQAALILLVVFSTLFIIIGCEQSSSREKQYRVGMSWLVRNSGTPLMYDKYEVTKVTKDTVSWRVTVLNKDRKPFGGAAGNEFTFPKISVKDLLEGEEETINVAGKSFPCRKIVSGGGTAWRSFEYPLITMKQKVQGMEKEIVEFSP